MCAAGTALATAGEDGSIKIWSRNGMLRSTLAQYPAPVYCVVWAADSDQLCFSTGSNIVIKSIQSSAKQQSWRAHEGVVLKLDWSAINHMVVSGGEDCKYKVRGEGCSMGPCTYWMRAGLTGDNPCT